MLLELSEIKCILKIETFNFESRNKMSVPQSAERKSDDDFEPTEGQSERDTHPPPVHLSAKRTDWTPKRKTKPFFCLSLCETKRKYHKVTQS